MNRNAPTAIDLYWLPLGAGGHSVRVNGKVFEWFAARLEHRDRCDLYHSALQVYLPEGRFVIEQAPAWGEGSRRGAVAEGTVGARWLGRYRFFRYEIRSWREGTIPDIAEAVESPRRLSEEPEQAQLLLDLAPQVPTPVWGRDELGTGEMWNSNSTISWLLARSSLDVESIPLPQAAEPPAGTPESRSHGAIPLSRSIRENLGPFPYSRRRTNTRAAANGPNNLPAGQQTWSPLVGRLSLCLRECSGISEKDRKSGVAMPHQRQAHTC